MPINDHLTKTARGTKQAKERDGNKRFWTTRDQRIAASRLFAWAQSLEQLSWHRRYRSLLYYRMMTGEAANPAFSFSMGARPGAISALYGRVQFSAPVDNVLAECDEVLANRVYRQRPFLQCCPTAGDFAARQDSKNVTRWLDAAFHELSLWKTVEKCGADSRMWGCSWLKVDVGPEDDIATTRILDDEVLFNEEEANLTDKPRTIGIRVFVHRDQLVELVNNRLGGDPEALAAVRNAPKVNLGYYFGSDLDTSDIVTLIEAWHIGTKKKPGKYILAVKDFAFAFEDYKKDHPPLAKLTYKEMPSGYRGQGMPAQVLGLMRELERFDAAAAENVRRMGWPRVLKPTGSNISDQALEGKSGGVISHAPQLPPSFVNPVAITGDQFAWRAVLKTAIKERFGISEQSAVGMQTSHKSGLAIERQSQLDDIRHQVLSLHLEDFVEQIGNLLIEAAEKCKPSFTLPGRQTQLIKWAELNFKAGSTRLRPFPMSSLPQSIDGRTEQIELWYSSGQISKATKMRLEAMPDIDGYIDLATAGQDRTEKALDQIVEKGEYVPPTPFGDLKDALATAQSRYLFEQNLETPQDRLDLILQFCAALEELIEDAMPAAAPGVPGAQGAGFGIQPPPGAPGNAPVPVPLPQQPNVPLPGLPA